MDEFRSLLAKKYGLEAAQSVVLEPPVTAASLRAAEHQAAQFKQSLPDGATSARSSASSFGAHAVQTKKKIGESGEGDLWGLVGKFERLHFERENAKLAREAETRKADYRAGLERQVAELNARRGEEIQERMCDRKRMDVEETFVRQVKQTEEQEKIRVRQELREFMASEAQRRVDQTAKKKRRAAEERRRILEIIEAEHQAGGEIKVGGRLNRKKEDIRAPWEKDEEEDKLTGSLMNEEKNRRIAICRGLDRQVEEKQEELKRQRELRKLEKRILDEDTLKAKEEEEEARIKRMGLRKQVDGILIQQMSQVFPMTKDEKMNRDGKNKDLVINQPLVRLMAQEPHFLRPQDKQLLLLSMPQ